MQEIRVRDMVVGDFPAVFEMGKREFDMTQFYHQYWNLSELSKHLEHDGELSIVAELGGRVVGFALGHRRFSMWESDLGHFEWIAVSRKHQRKGVGSLLCREMLKRFHRMRVTRVLTDIRGENIASTKLFEKFSFRKTFSVDWLLKEGDPS